MFTNDRIRNKVMQRTLWIVVTLGIAFAGCSDGGKDESSEGGGGGPPQQGSDAANVRVAPIRVETVQERRLVTGRIRAAQRSVVAAEEPGRVIVAPPDIGSTVDANDVLADLDRSLVETERRVAVAALEESQAQVQQARATYDQAAALRQRYERLIKQGGITEVQLDQAVRDEQVAGASLETARANVASSKATIEQLDIRLAKMTIRAPFAGAVVSKDTELGQWLSPGSPVVAMVRTNQVDAELMVPERMLRELAVDQAIGVRVDAAGGVFDGRVHRIVPDADARARSFPVLIRIDNDDGRLKPGMSAEAELPTGEAVPATLVPRDAVQVTPTGTIAYVNRGGVASPAPLTIRFTIDDLFVVDGPLRAGDSVVIEGNERLRPGQELNVQNGPASDTAAPNDARD